MLLRKTCKCQGSKVISLDWNFYSWGQQLVFAHERDPSCRLNMGSRVQIVFIVSENRTMKTGWSTIVVVASISNVFRISQNILLFSDVFRGKIISFLIWTICILTTHICTFQSHVEIFFNSNKLTTIYFQFYPDLSLFNFLYVLHVFYTIVYFQLQYLSELLKLSWLLPLSPCCYLRKITCTVYVHTNR